MLTNTFKRETIEQIDQRYEKMPSILKMFVKHPDPEGYKMRRYKGVVSRYGKRVYLANRELSPVTTPQWQIEKENALRKQQELEREEQAKNQLLDQLAEFEQTKSEAIDEIESLSYKQYLELKSIPPKQRQQNFIGLEL